MLSYWSHNFSITTKPILQVWTTLERIVQVLHLFFCKFSYRDFCFLTSNMFIKVRLCCRQLALRFTQPHHLVSFLVLISGALLCSIRWCRVFCCVSFCDMMPTSVVRQHLLNPVYHLRFRTTRKSPTSTVHSSAISSVGLAYGWDFPLGRTNGITTFCNCQQLVICRQIIALKLPSIISFHWWGNLARAHFKLFYSFKNNWRLLI